jgi:hypothetical protein
MSLSQIATLLTIATLVAVAFSFGAVPKVTRVARMIGVALGVLAVVAHIAD